MPLSKQKLIFDPADLTDSDNVGAYLRAGTDGTLIGTTTVSGSDPAINVFVVNDSASTPEKSEDAAHSSGDVGDYVLAVRQDTLASSVSTDGDYASFKLNARGGLWTVPVGTVDDDAVDTENPAKVGGKAYTMGTALAAVSAGDRTNLAQDLYRRVITVDTAGVAIAHAIVTVGATAVALPTVPLAGRRKIIVQNKSNNPVWLGTSSVTISGATEGLKLEKGSFYEENISAGVVLYAIASGAGNDVLAFEAA